MFSLFCVAKGSYSQRLTGLRQWGNCISRLLENMVKSGSSSSGRQTHAHLQVNFIIYA